METKKCSKCGEVKDVSEFHRDKNQKNGLRTACKKCVLKQFNEYRINNPEKIKERDKRYRLENPEKIKEKNTKWKLNNTEKIKEIKEKYRLNNIEKERERTREYQRKSATNADDRYIKQRLFRSGFTTEQINENQELIEIKRLIIKTKRLCKTLQNSEKV